MHTHIFRLRRIQIAQAETLRRALLRLPQNIQAVQSQIALRFDAVRPQRHCPRQRFARFFIFLLEMAHFRQTIPSIVILFVQRQSFQVTYFRQRITFQTASRPRIAQPNICTLRLLRQQGRLKHIGLSKILCIKRQHRRIFQTIHIIRFQRQKRLRRLQTFHIEPRIIERQHQIPMRLGMIRLQFQGLA